MGRCWAAACGGAPAAPPNQVSAWMPIRMPATRTTPAASASVTFEVPLAGWTASSSRRSPGNGEESSLSMSLSPYSWRKAWIGLSLAARLAG